MAQKTDVKLVYESRETLYQKALETMATAKLMVKFSFKRDTYLKAAKMFEETGDYLEAGEYAKQCHALAEETREDEKEYLYQRAAHQQQIARSYQGLEKAAALYDELGDYQDAAACRDRCAQRSAELKRKKLYKRRILLILVLLMLIGSIAVLHSERVRGIWSRLAESQDAGQSTPAKVVTLQNAEPGDKLTFGIHEWYVLEREGDTLRLLLTHAEQFEDLRHRPYHERLEEVTWEECSIREWLNGSFLTQDFTPEEQEMILEKPVENRPNGVYGTENGSLTYDKVTLLEPEEIEVYYDIVHNIRMNIWLKSAGASGELAAFMAATNVAMYYGYPVTDINFYTCPVIWIRTE